MAGLISDAELAAMRADFERSFADEVIRIRHADTGDDELGQSTVSTASSITIYGRINHPRDDTDRLYAEGTNVDRGFTAAYDADIIVGDTLIINLVAYRVVTVFDLGVNSLVSQYNISMISEGT